MARLKQVPLTDLEQQLDEFDEKRPVMRLLAAIIYKQGPSALDIADWFDVRPATVYRWFERIEEAEDLATSIRDAPRPGRPEKLDSTAREEFFDVVRQRPAVAGLDSPRWTPRVAQQYLNDRFEVEYSVRHVRRLMREAGV